MKWCLLGLVFYNGVFCNGLLPSGIGKEVMSLEKNSEKAQSISITRFRDEQRGASLVEYALLAALIAIAAIGSFTFMGQEAGKTFVHVGNEMAGTNFPSTRPTPP